MLVLSGKTWLDFSGEQLEKGVDVPFPRSVNSTRPQDEKRDFMSKHQGQLFSSSFAPAVG